MNKRNKSDSDEQKRPSVFQEKRNTGTLQNWETMMTKKDRQFFSGKIGVTPSVAAPGDTHPSDATGKMKSRFYSVAVWITSTTRIKHCTVRFTQYVIRRWFTSEFLAIWFNTRDFFKNRYMLHEFNFAKPFIDNNHL